MKALRPRLSYANVVSTLCLVLLLGGGAAYAAAKLGKNSVGPGQLRKGAVTTAKVKDQAITAAKVKDGTLTGRQIDASTLGTVPNSQSAQSAQVASGLTALEAWHEVGTQTGPEFKNGWGNLPGPTPRETVAFYRDHEGIVHLRGVAKKPGGGQIVFELPPGFRPAAGRSIQFVIGCGECGPAPEIIRAEIQGSNGAVVGGGGILDFTGIAFRAES